MVWIILQVLENMRSGLLVHDVILVLFHPVANLTSCFSNIFWWTIITIYLVNNSRSLRNWSLILDFAKFWFEGNGWFMSYIDWMFSKNAANTFGSAWNIRNGYIFCIVIWLRNLVCSWLFDAASNFVYLMKGVVILLEHFFNMIDFFLLRVIIT